MNKSLDSCCCSLPINILEESFNVICPLQAIIDHKGVFEDIEDEDRVAARRMRYIVLVNPEIV